MIVQNANADEALIISATYGGETMSKVRFHSKTAGVLAGLYLFFLGSGIPSGAQTVAVSDAGGAAKAAVVMTLTADGDTTVEGDNSTDTGAGTTIDPSLTVVTGAGVVTTVYGLLWSGHDTTIEHAPGTDYLSLAEHDFGTKTARWERRSPNANGGDVIVNFSDTPAEQAAVLGVAVKDLASGRRRRGMMGLGR